MSTLFAAAGYYSPYVKYWELPAFSQKPNPTPIPGAIGVDAALSPDGQYLAVANENTSVPIRCWNTSDGSSITLANAPSGNPGKGVDFSDDGQYLIAVCGGTGTDRLRIWNVGTWTEVSYSLPDAFYLTCCRFSEGSNYAVLGMDYQDNYIVLETSGWAEVTGFPAVAGRAKAVDINETADIVAVQFVASPYFSVIDLTSKSVLWSSTDISNLGEDRGKTVSISRDGVWVAVGYSGGDNIRVYEARTGADVVGGPGTGAPVTGVRFNDDVSELAMARGNNDLTFYNTSNWSSSTQPHGGLWPYGLDYDGPSGPAPTHKSSPIMLGTPF